MGAETRDTKGNVMDHPPHYHPTERTRYKVRIESIGRVITLSQFDTLEKAQRAYIKARNESRLGGSGWSSGDVFDEMGQHVARISYNGRLWPPLPWAPGMEPYAEVPRDPRIAKTCEFCGSEHVWLDANAEWDFEAQRWVLKNTFDNAWCDECDGETTIIDKEIP